MNDLMSFGIHRLWKDSRLIAAAYAVGRPCWIWLVHRRPDSEILPPGRRNWQSGLADINESMLKMGREKLRNIG